MAYTKIFAVRNKLARAVSYAVNPDKITFDEQGLADMVGYALDPEKTHARLFESAINCENPETAYSEMLATKERYRKPSGVLAYHVIQSFKPGEVSAAKAHEIGVAFAREMFGNDYEVVVGTHLDKNHYHNHIVVNSVAFTNGIKYHSDPRSYYKDIRGLSDRLCRENGLSIIDPQKRGKHYKQWYDEKNGVPNWHSLIKADIDDAIRASFNFNTFVEQMKRRGYSLKFGSVKHMTVRPKGADKNFRLSSMNDPRYTEDAIRKRIQAVREGKDPDSIPGLEPAPKMVAVVKNVPKRFKPKAPIRADKKRKKLKGFIALYWKYCYMLRRTAARRLPNRAAFLFRDDVRKLEQFKRQFLFLHRNGIETVTDLKDYRKKNENALAEKVTRRAPLYKQSQRKDGTEREAIKSEIQRLNAEIKELRHSLRLCGQIEDNAARVYGNCAQSDEALANRKKANEKQHEKDTKRKDEKL